MRRVAVWYIGALVLSNAGGIVALPMEYLLKERFPSAMGLTQITILLAVPGYAAFAFGYVRDRFSPFGLGDRGLLLIALGLATIGYGALALGGTETARLVALTLGLGAAGQLRGAAWNGALVAFGRRFGVTDRISALGNGLGNVLAAGVSALGGWLVLHASTGTVFGIVALANGLLLALALRSPPAAFAARTVASKSVGHPARAIAELVRHRTFLVLLGMGLAWNFSLSIGTPTFLFLTDGLRLTPAQVGLTGTAESSAIVPIALLYGLLGRRWPLRRILQLSIVLATVQPFAYFVMRGPTEAIVAYALFGITGALWNVASFDLLLRLLPRHLAGTGFALIATVCLLSAKLSEIAGAALYDRGGFWLGVWLTPPVTALMLPLLALLPGRLDAPMPTDAGATDQGAEV